MKIRTALLAILLASAASATAAQYQRIDRGPVQPQTGRFGDPTDIARHLQGFVYGVVTQVNSYEMVCDKTASGDAQAFKLNKKTKYISDGKPASPDALKPGEEVWVKLKRDKKTGEMTALSVVMGLPPTATR